MPIPAVNGSALLPLPMRQSPKGSVTPSHVVETDTGERERRKRALFAAKGYSAQDNEDDEDDYYEDAAAAEAEAEAETEAEAEAEGEAEGEGDEHHIVHLLHANGRPMEPGSEG